MNEELQYFAFISYKRGGMDESIANWIHSKLEKYPYPKDLVLPENRPQDEDLIRRVFIDTKDLHVSEECFTEEIKEAIKNSRYLLLICSNASATSEYVNQEVAYFLETHDNDSGKILPIFIDKVDNSLPQKLQDTDILSRHCPIYNTFLDQRNEINLYCFYHIVAFLLKADFRDIYDRYKQYAERKKRHRKLLRYGINSMMVLIILVASVALSLLLKLTNKQAEIVKLEKEIFPYSVVTGYVKNFLSPVVTYFAEYEPDAHLFIHMPTEVSDMVDNHKYRFDEVSATIERRLSLDSMSKVTLKTSIPRGSITHKMYSSKNENINHTYLDFATTTTTFLEIAKKKKAYKPYADMDLDDMIEEYTNIFISQAKGLLGADSTRVTFIKELYEIESYVK